MNLPKLIKENLVLTIGIMLPVLLILVFLSMMLVQKIGHEAPAFDALYSVDFYDSSAAVASNTFFSVKDEKLNVKVVKNATNYPSYYRKKLYIYERATGQSREIIYKLPDDQGEAETVLNETRDYKLSSSAISPDGYEFLAYDYNDGGSIFTGMFLGLGGSYRNRPVIKKGISRYRLDKLPENSYNFQFVGWVLSK